MTILIFAIMKKKYKPIHVSGKRTTRQQRYFENIELKNAAERRAAQWIAEREGISCITYERVKESPRVSTVG